jgi:hypothetical protein
LASLLVQKEDLVSSILRYQDKIDYGETTDITSFDNKLLNFYTLDSLTKEIIILHKSILTTNQKIYYDSNNVVTKTGGVSIVITIGLSLALGLGVAMITNLVMDLSNYKKVVISKNDFSKKNDKEEENKEA